jgi:beta-galactosidase
VSAAAFDDRVQIAVIADLIGGSLLTTTYTVFGDGSVYVSQSFTPGVEELPELPRFGMSMTLPQQLDHVTWFGRGPHESYADRKTSAAVDLWQGPVSEQSHLYVRPQETGNKTDVRWLALTDVDGVGLMAIGDPLLNASAWPFAQEDLDFELKPTPGGRRGGGRDNSWGALPHPQYRLEPQAYSYGFWLRPVRGDAADWPELARRLPDRAAGVPGR